MNYFNTEDLLAMFSSSSDAELIANDFTQALNEAIKIQKEKEEKEEKEKRAAAAKAAQEEKETLAAKLLEDIIVFGEKYYPKIFTPDVRSAITVKDFISSLDSTYKLMSSITSTGDMLAASLDDIMAPKKDEKKTSADPLLEFLKREGLF